MELLLTFNPYSRGACLNNVVKALRDRGFRVDVVYDWELRSVIKVGSDDIYTVLHLISTVMCVSNVYVIYTITGDRSIENITRTCIELVSKMFRGADVYIETRRWDKSYELKSVEVARNVAKEIASLGLAIPSYKGKNVIFIGIDKEFVVIGYADNTVVEMFKRSSIPSEIARNIVAIVDSPQTDYELMDLIQLSRAIGFELRLYKPNQAAMNAVLKILNIKLPENVVIADSLEEALDGIDIAIALSMYSRYNEKTLIELLRNVKEKKIAFVLGNEYKDVSPELREKCDVEIRLGPETGFALRVATALAYALGISLTILAGYIEP
uniref:Uncharacterized protein n=1 Tax=Ignisphaera aggregans TaxID=334771 RepID=A0A7C2V9F4_9CREN